MLMRFHIRFVREEASKTHRPLQAPHLGSLPVDQHDVRRLQLVDELARLGEVRVRREADGVHRHLQGHLRTYFRVWGLGFRTKVMSNHRLMKSVKTRMLLLGHLRTLWWCWSLQMALLTSNAASRVLRPAL